MVGLTKNILLNSLRISRLPFDQLKETLVESEVTLNNHSLGYLEHDVKLSALTPNMLIQTPHEYLSS